MLNINNVFLVPVNLVENTEGETVVRDHPGTGFPEIIFESVPNSFVHAVPALHVLVDYDYEKDTKKNIIRQFHDDSYLAELGVDNKEFWEKIYENTHNLEYDLFDLFHGDKFNMFYNMLHSHPDMNGIFKEENANRIFYIEPTNPAGFASCVLYNKDWLSGLAKAIDDDLEICLIDSQSILIIPETVMGVMLGKGDIEYNKEDFTWLYLNKIIGTIYYKFSKKYF